ncbi:glycine N-acyltransferase-like protein 3 isoform X1 [Nerophis lumbriciformis]|uniref:glycine N-acyltransferase-like protein 3 isoform X1 n=1 Tax=Nerophis lumbriciformis TaxID=546530 RepID=UPI002AE01E38|nr:glycine N-acyltransferase-like protein 3 isoform X1 [Nerophis lumbriciformis]XP_061816094.1 glycine N-acyltransferase-like protein 3 isoform X1 [Nerophis lumbriciformis]XP_061816103.1 glycine N-acyltransferase-like protein 3 isoform X1 [Nerophis lumbriciformis]XP_061816112.1 glycine N-acyltransferase-like protein 3 isoform X1 [Nerophis lumbriciformis]XP_061816117.1 glycine N-acyltransferase-like protein 3 isoform X1 [Nerophis lumbriciformis]XP_061816127.1 glycine N-acyltransferase-like prot
MKVLQKDEVLIAEGKLLKYLPKCFQIFGVVFAFNKNKTKSVQFIVDTWPDFKVIICRTDPQKNRGFTRKVSLFSTDERILKKMLSEEDPFDWSSCFRLGGCDVSHTTMLKEVSSNRNVNCKCVTVTHLLYLPGSSHLVTPTFDSQLKYRISSLDCSHADLVNRTWKLGGTEQAKNNVTFLISNFPSCCITDYQGRPISWMGMYESLAIGMLYTQPEHRQKGYAKVLVHTMARRLLADGYPVFCYIEEGNAVSYKLFKSMGFIEDPSFRASLFEFKV